MTAPKPLPTPLPWKVNGLPDGDYRARAAARRDIEDRVRPYRKALNILSALATGHLPWGVPWPGGLTRHGNTWHLCCGHTMTFDAASRFVSAGLLQEVRRADDTEALAITEAGRIWLAEHWPT